MREQVRHLLLVVLCSCGRIGFDTAADANGSARDGDALTCANGMPAEDFATGSACGSWGVTTMRGIDMARNNGQLELTPSAAPATGNDFGGCSLNAYDLRRGVFIEAISVLAGSQAYTNLIAYTPTQAGIQVNGNDNSIRMMLDGTDVDVTPYDPVAMRFWQLVSSGSVLHLNYSPDAVHWTELTSTDRGSDDLTAAGVTFGAGRFGQTATGIATFDNLNACP